ncbi:hypothetical protein F5Y17DRAFT_50082 [Xylariaceae sp. FL0594]|nr:hypothetical protein F5Y17DRAFT_50082 [Xylariaceae sp. FL0594]
MRRSGYERVRTGCRSCKARKVKCDEGRPDCRRCLSSGRTCAGYQTRQPWTFSWGELLRARPSLVGDSSSVTKAEWQSLDFFRCTVAPALAGAVGKDFWTISVMQQVMHQSPARNAVLAISSLYRGFDHSLNDSALAHESVAPIVYYNKALKQVATTRCLDTETALLLAILFTCIEFLRGNVPDAIGHCRHGIQILRSAKKPSPDASAIFRHLSIFPFFFGASLSDFPHPPHVRHTEPCFHDTSQAAEALDDLMSRTVRLVRACDPLRFATIDSTRGPPTLLLSVQQDLRQEMDEWLSGFSATRAQQQHGMEGRNRSLCRTLEMRWLVCRIWVDIALCQDETLCDTYQTSFQRIIQLAREEALSRKLNGTERPSLFQFDMGLSPLLYFVVIKCRFLQLRLQALDLFRALACTRESMWETSLLYAVAKRSIEREHNLDLTTQSLGEVLECPDLMSKLPRKSERIRDSVIHEETKTQIDGYGCEVTLQRIYFWLRRSDAVEVAAVPDWICLPQNRPYA